MYIDENYTNYKYLVSASDNYYVLSSRSYINGEWNNPDTVPVIYQYLSPSFQVVETEYTSTSYRDFDNVSSQFDSSFWARPDCPQIFICQFLIVVAWVWLINQLTKIVSKGGVFK